MEEGEMDPKKGKTPSGERRVTANQNPADGVEGKAGLRLVVLSVWAGGRE